ncbi:hypothetical protein RhiirA5_501235 [Rhizophagus irregularis]|uniref:RING-type domain-containing protein n=2 Tax=Rhizophagus irregularis TaxID=588596 RepID=U9U803_RHIID|nr:hypothetical protein GLOIN_2v1544399 [Rhizophagus irregularis DAOM 181602=DAOM 197198]PKC06624.1 hypothetical protein RhiirA5_501235 [Rhizophagus irregularis]PKC69269.1 hypothetical protein RhiirA1_533565 [Rhizophagus irregularis]PKK71746.1 hypothetical protein RhiirC2_710890 [Rhizophagus irregularis]PKY13331.1 hypothetical protein RhiirB3_518711 [Rhizophagus irregularis]POG77883.1 hypothetical protein GLOIN_2v1544399 [Rhizophagus irregularis DAOM 181602=DAOM 197198]|eukprot:XP_025184749.1 hypothetical protein GLOIN_2v1544399 [Rhizophagus irregularis DAOM 181602=DAOM 197198]
MGNEFSQHHENMTNVTSAQNQHTSCAPLVSLYEPSSINNNKLNKKQEPSSNLSSNNENTDNICYICSDQMEIYSISKCNHRTCHLCSLRTRILLDSDTCAYCRTQQNEVLLTRDSKKSFEELKSSSINWITISKINVLCEDASIFHTATQLMEFQCPSKNCKVMCKDWHDLSCHVRIAHNKLFCTMCIVNRKIFISEHQLYTREELVNHYNGNNTADPYFQGHPSCSECSNIHFYDSSELYDHYLIHHKFVPNANLLRPSDHSSHSTSSSTSSQEHLIEASDIDIPLLIMCIISGLLSIIGNIIGNITGSGCHDFERFFHSLEDLFVTLMNYDDVNNNDQSFEIILRNMASSLYKVGGRCLMLFMYLMIIFWVLKGWFFFMSWAIYVICVITFGKICWENLTKSFTSRD